MSNYFVLNFQVNALTWRAKSKFTPCLYLQRFDKDRQAGRAGRQAGQGRAGQGRQAGRQASTLTPVPRDLKVVLAAVNTPERNLIVF